MKEISEADYLKALAVVKAYESQSDILPEKDKPVHVGYLYKPFGINGHSTAQIGHPVYETKDRYLIYLMSDLGASTPVPFYKETLEKSIIKLEKVPLPPII